MLSDVTHLSVHGENRCTIARHKPCLLCAVARFLYSLQVPRSSIPVHSGFSIAMEVHRPHTGQTLVPTKVLALRAQHSSAGGLCTSISFRKSDNAGCCVAAARMQVVRRKNSAFWVPLPTTQRMSAKAVYATPAGDDRRVDAGHCARRRRRGHKAAERLRPTVR